VRVAATACALAVLVAGCGEGGQAEREDPFANVERGFRKFDPSKRSSPRWAPVRTLSGTGSKSASVEIDGGAIQWRARWRCRKGSFSVAVDPQPAGSEAARGKCPATRTATYIGSGKRKLTVTASAPWRLTVEQQLDTPLRQPPLAEMKPSRAATSGEFGRIERTGRGTATIYELPAGRRALRLENFVTDPNSDLFVWLSRARAPTTTKQVLAAPHRSIAALKATVGDHNYELPRGMRVEEVRSIVIWCRPVRIAYTAAPLKPVRGR